jgi:hypothetical protein
MLCSSDINYSKVEASLPFPVSRPTGSVSEAPRAKPQASMMPLDV